MNHHPAETHTTGVLLTNLGTPSAPTTKAIRQFLAEFLSDPRVVELPKSIRTALLYGFILPTRPQKILKQYQKIWMDNGSPLRVLSESLSKRLQEKVDPQKLTIALGMRYGKPSIAHALAELKHAKARRIIVLPLYPQYSASTTGSTFDAIANEIKTWRWVPELHMINHYADHPLYIDAIVQRIKQHWQHQNPAKKLLFSFHGMPEKTLSQGDPYYCLCLKTARLIAEQLNLEKDRWIVVFQSRFGKTKWFEPYCVDTLESLAKQGCESVDIVCPGFAVDCLETLEEIAQTNRARYLKAGGKTYHYIPALNDSPAHVDLLEALLT